MGYAVTQFGKVDSATLGNRHKCNSCGTAWYDLGRENSVCPGPSAEISCEDGSLLRAEFEEHEVEEEEDETPYLSEVLGEDSDDLFDDPEGEDSEFDEDWEEDDDVEYVDISSDEDEDF